MPDDLVAVVPDPVEVALDDLPTDFFAHTDYGNAERLVASEGDDLMYVPGPGWHVWTGKRWMPDEDGRVQRRAKRAIRRTHELGVLMARVAEDDDAPLAQHEREELRDRAAALKRHARQSESAGGLAAMVRLAESEMKVISKLDELDSDPFLLNVANGTVDLRTGDLLVPDRAHRITRYSQVVYDPDATDPQWERVLSHVDFGYDGTLREYLRLAAGYSATGSVREDLAHLIDGPGGTTKSTFADPVRRCVGEYGAVVAFDMFVQRRGDQGHPTDLATLMGARFVTSEEGPKNRSLDAAKIKSLSGGTPVTARFMRGDPFTYDPQMKIWLVTNYRPKVHAEDSGAWRRLRAVPFTNRTPDAVVDPNLREYLQKDPGAQSAVLAWVVSGARDWFAAGRLVAPQCVLERTAAWRGDTDRVGAWLDDECTLDPDAWTNSTALQTSINEWWKLNVQDDGWTPPSLLAGLGEELRARGCEQKRRGHESTRGWAGISLRNGLGREGSP